MNLFMSIDHFILFTPAFVSCDFMAGTLSCLEALVRTDGGIAAPVTRVVLLALLLVPGSGSLTITADRVTRPVASEALVLLRVCIFMFSSAFQTNCLIFFRQDIHLLIV